MLRRIEWVLTLLGAALCTLDFVLYWKYVQGPGTPHWPFSAFPLVEILLLGWVGVAGMILDSGSRSNAWGAVQWVIAGGLTPHVLVGGLSIGPLLIPAVVLFIASGLVANHRRGRNLLPDITFFSIGAVVNLVLIITLAQVLASV
jgi:hypothetical protein